MILFPKMYCKGVPYIDIEELKHNNIKGIAIDVDNTLIDYKKIVSEDIKKWVELVKQSELKICILSNSNNKIKVESVAKTLDLEYIMFAQKPMKKGFKKAMKLLDLPAENIAVIGDQVFTDVIGANRMNMLSIYVEPINKKEYWYTKWKRPIEAIILKASNKMKEEVIWILFFTI